MKIILHEGPIIDYRYAANWNPVPKDREAGDLRSFMSSLTEADGSHGGRFHYVCQIQIFSQFLSEQPECDILIWLAIDSGTTGSRSTRIYDRRS